MNNDQLISEVKELLSKCFNTTRIEIIDDSKNHVGHSGNSGGAHLNLEIVAIDFEELSRLKGTSLFINV